MSTSDSITFYRYKFKYILGKNVLLLKSLYLKLYHFKII